MKQQKEKKARMNNWYMNVSELWLVKEVRQNGYMQMSLGRSTNCF